MFGIIGVNPIATIAIQIIRKQLPGEAFFFVDDDEQKMKRTFDGVEVLYNKQALQKKIENGNPFNLAISFGEKLLAKKKILFHELNEFANVSFPILKHETAIVSELAAIHDGNILSFGTIIGHKTILKPASVFWGGVVVEHDCVIGESCYLAPNVTISGFVKIGDCSLIGSGAVVMPEVKIGNNCIVGAGAVVTKNVPDNSIVAGVPAKFIRSCN
ncbi:MAG: acetyltransferase [Ferruginibacter sp.]